MNHIVAISGGKDSTALAVRLAEVEQRDYTYVCTPTGRELPEMIAHWDRLEEILGKPLIRVKAAVSLVDRIRLFKMLPSHHARWCTRLTKILPYQEWLADKVPAVSYVGLRADEDRLGAVYDPQSGITQDYPLRRWGWGLNDVLGYLRKKHIIIPRRTDCDFCYDQRLSEWWELWKNHPVLWREAEGYEAETDHTFRSPHRDTWPAALRDLRARFEAGEIPKVKLQDEYERCRVCSL